MQLVFWLGEKVWWRLWWLNHVKVRLQVNLQWPLGADTQVAYHPWASGGKLVRVACRLLGVGGWDGSMDVQGRQ